MKKIIRFNLAIEPSQRIKVPFNSQILKFDTFKGDPCVWILADEAFSGIDRTFVMVEKEVEQRINETHYLGSFEAKAKDIGSRVLHVFEST